MSGQSRRDWAANLGPDRAVLLSLGSVIENREGESLRLSRWGSSRSASGVDSLTLGQESLLGEPEDPDQLGHAAIDDCLRFRLR